MERKLAESRRIKAVWSQKKIDLSLLVTTRDIACATVLVQPTILRCQMMSCNPWLELSPDCAMRFLERLGSWHEHSSWESFARSTALSCGSSGSEIGGAKRSNWVCENKKRTTSKAPERYHIEASKNLTAEGTWWGPHKCVTMRGRILRRYASGKLND
jgi:hypothetical protein